jgi:acetyltransferase-like isoleucine patch superfamily enzyme
MKDLITNLVYRIILRIRLIELRNQIGKFSRLGINSSFELPLHIINHESIHIGDNFFSRYNLRIEAIKNYNNQKFSPQIHIGNNVQFNSDIHIGCIDYIEIGDNCLLGSRILITDHDHGTTVKDSLQLPPLKRNLYSKGPVIIKNNVWIGDGVSILAGVTIGENTIIGTNAVVTKSVPAYSILVGNPGRLINLIDSSINND